MMIIEMREAAIDKAFEKLDEVKHHAKKTKLTLCELEDAMYDCYEAVKEQSDEEYEDREDFEIPSEDDDEEELELAYRGSGSRSGMRRAMRMRYRDDDDMNIRGMRRSARRMRRARRSSRY